MPAAAGAASGGEPLSHSAVLKAPALRRVSVGEPSSLGEGASFGRVSPRAAPALQPSRLSLRQEGELAELRSASSSLNAKLAAFKAQMLALVSRAGPVGESAQQQGGTSGMCPHLQGRGSLPTRQAPPGSPCACAGDSDEAAAWWPAGCDLWGPNVCVLPACQAPASPPQLLEGADQGSNVLIPAGPVAEAVESDAMRAARAVDASVSGWGIDPWGEALIGSYMQRGGELTEQRRASLERPLTLDQRLSLSRSRLAPEPLSSRGSLAVALSYEGVPSISTEGLGFFDAGRRPSAGPTAQRSWRPTVEQSPLVLDRGEPTLESTISELRERQAALERVDAPWGGGRAPRRSSGAGRRRARSESPDQAPPPSPPPRRLSRSLSPRGLRLAASWTRAASDPAAARAVLLPWSGWHAYAGSTDTDVGRRGTFDAPQLGPGPLEEGLAASLLWATRDPLRMDPGLLGVPRFFGSDPSQLPDQDNGDVRSIPGASAGPYTLYHTAERMASGKRHNRLGGEHDTSSKRQPLGPGAGVPQHAVRKASVESNTLPGNAFQRAQEREAQRGPMDRLRQTQHGIPAKSAKLEKTGPVSKPSKDQRAIVSEMSSDATSAALTRSSMASVWKHERARMLSRRKHSGAQVSGSRHGFARVSTPACC